MLVVLCDIFSCSLWDLAPCPGMEPRPPTVGAQSLSHQTTRDITRIIFSAIYFFESTIFFKAELQVTPCKDFTVAQKDWEQRPGYSLYLSLAG